MQFDDPYKGTHMAREMHATAKTDGTIYSFLHARRSSTAPMTLPASHLREYSKGYTAYATKDTYSTVRVMSHDTHKERAGAVSKTSVFWRRSIAEMSRLAFSKNVTSPDTVPPKHLRLRRCAMCRHICELICDDDIGKSTAPLNPACMHR